MKSKYPKSIPIVGRVKLCLSIIDGFEISGKTIVDIGCSHGWLARILLKKYKLNYFGLDTDDDAIKFARKNTGKAKFTTASAENLDFKEHFADIVFMLDVIEHVPQGTELSCLKEAYRVLKRGGILLLRTPNSHILADILDPAWYFGHRHYSQDEIISLVKRAGFLLKSKIVRGGIISMIYMLWFYISKWLLGKRLPRSKFWEKKTDSDYQKPYGIHSHFIIARK